MYRRAGRKPDFFTVVVLLVVVGFGLTIAVQLETTEVDRVVESLAVEKSISASQAPLEVVDRLRHQL